MEQKIENFLNEKLFTILIIITMVSMPAGQLLGNFLGKKITPFFQSFYQEEILSTCGIVLLVALIVFYLLSLKNKCKIYFVLSDVFIALSILFCINSIVFSKDLYTSLHGEYTYSETPLQVLAYFCLFFSCSLIKNNKNKQLILNTFIILAITESLIAFLQNFEKWPSTCYFDNYSHTLNHLAFGLTSHCNFFAAISIVFTAIFSAKFLSQSFSKKDSFLYFLGSIFCCFATFFTYTRISWLGIIAIVIGLIIIEISYFIKNKDKITLKTNITKIIILTITFSLAFGALMLFSNIGSDTETHTNTKMSAEITSVKKELSEISTNFNNFGTRRGTIWIVGLNALKRYPLTGVGFDNYRYSFSIYPKRLGWAQNKGHNEFIHVFVTQGIPSGINYLLFSFYCCFFAFKKILKQDSAFGKDCLTRIFLIAIFAYFVQSLFNSSVTNVAPYKWILMGLLLPRIEQRKLFKK